MLSFGLPFYMGGSRSTEGGHDQACSQKSIVGPLSLGELLASFQFAIPRQGNRASSGRATPAAPGGNGVFRSLEIWVSAWAWH